MISEVYIFSLHIGDFCNNVLDFLSLHLKTKYVTVYPSSTKAKPISHTYTNIPDSNSVIEFSILGMATGCRTAAFSIVLSITDMSRGMAAK